MLFYIVVECYYHFFFQIYVTVVVVKISLYDYRLSVIEDLLPEQNNKIIYYYFIYFYFYYYFIIYR